MKKLILSTAVALSTLAAAPAYADKPEFTLTLENNAFSPANLEIPAGEKVKIRVKNNGTTAAEFESHELKREKIIGAGKEAVIFVGPLDEGSYAYFDEFHPEATGTITAKKN